MRKVLFILCVLCLSCSNSDFKNRTSFKLMGKKRCGANTPCQCGYVLAENRMLNGQDNLQNCDSNTKVAALTLINGAKLDCAGETISVRLNSKGNYDNIATAIWIKSDSNGSEVKNCKIIGFGEAIYTEFEYIYGQTSVEERVPSNLSFANNTIMLGQGCPSYGASCEANGIYIPGTLKTSAQNVSVVGNYFGMMRSPKTDKDSFLHYGSYFRTTGAKNVVIAFNYFDKINYGYALRLLYGVENTWIVGNTFRMPWERYQITPKWTPSGISIEMYNHAKEGYPTFSMFSFNTFLMSEDAHWPPEPFGAPPATGVNHEYVGIRSGWGPAIPPVDARFNWWKKLDGTNYSDADIARLIYGKNYTVYGVQYEPDYRGILYLPRLY